MADVLLGLDGPVVDTDDEVYSYRQSFGGIDNLSHPRFLGVAGMFGGLSTDEEDTAGLVGVIVFGAAADTVGRSKVSHSGSVRRSCAMPGSLIRFMVSHGGHDGEIGGHELRLEEVDLFRIGPVYPRPLGRRYS